jgi:CBS domain-containing protein
MAIVGPLTSLVLAGIFWSLAQVIAPQDNITKAIISYLAIINALLAAFNLIPGFPLDGGRVLRSIIWGATRDLRKATNIAATAGQIFGWGFIAFGVYSLFTGNFLGGLWIAFIGWFLSNAADASRRDASMREHLHGVKVVEIMDTSPRCLGTTELVGDVVRDVFFQQGARAAAVCEQERVIGIITITDVKRLPQSRWNDTAVTKIMTSEPLYSVGIDDDLSTAMRLLAQHELNQLLVLDRGRLVGLLSRAHVIRYLQLSQELHLPPRRGRNSGT